MPAEVKKEIQFEIAHVLFIDIVGYTKLSIDEQAEHLERLREIARCTKPFRIAQAEGKLMRLPTGDGGAVKEVTDLSEQGNIAGAGINVAQRVMDCGDAGHILLSKRVADDLEHYQQWRPLLHDLGTCVVKHGVTLALFNLYSEEIGN